MILFIFFAFLLIVSIIMFVDGVRNGYGEIWGTALGFIAAIILINYWAYTASFESAVRTDIIRNGLIAEYRSAIQMYQDKTVISVKDLSYTDFKYEGYQKNIADMIVSVRSLVHEHNEIIISKQAYKNHLIYGWYIIMPKNEQLIHVVE